MTPHHDKITALLQNAAFAAKRQLLETILIRYQAWRAASEKVKSRGSTGIKELTHLLNQYKDFLDQPVYKSRTSGFSPQTFLHSSVLEEFCALLLAPLQTQTLLSPGGKNTYVEMQFRPLDLNSFCKLPPIVVTTKDQDFAFGKEVLIACSYDQHACQTVRAFVPVVCLECKTNFDKTMYTSASDTARNIKRGAPACFYCVVMEVNDLALDFSPQGSFIDQIYWLRHPDRGHSRGSLTDRSPIDWRTVDRLYNDIAAHLKKTWFDPRQGEASGVLI